MVNRQTFIRPPTRVFEEASIHPSECRSFPYSQETRSQALHNRIIGADGPENLNIQNLRQNRLYPSEWSVDRWTSRHLQYNHIRPYRRTGNHRSRREIKHQKLILLAWHRAALPKATIAEVNAFIFAMNLNDPNNRFHSYSQIHRAEKSIVITKKRSSTTAFQAMNPANVQRRHNFWNLPYPFGCIDIDPRDMIDLDEAGIYATETNRKYGKGVAGNRCCEVGTYVKDGKLNILLAISGDDAPGQANRWVDLWEEGGTTNERFLAFVESILTDIGPGTNERRRTFTMDNLNAHTNPTIFARIIGAGHRILFRAPYFPVDGPIEYVFNTVQNTLCLFMRDIVDMATLRVKVEEVIGSLDHFHNYFDHVGFHY